MQNIKKRYSVIGNSPMLNRALDVALQVAPTDLSVLIIGESGVGKEVIPRIIHDNSPRKREKYFTVNCGSIPEGTIDSELFGHEKGSFTGAVGESSGYFGAADKGTLFLDEVGELPLSTQARLLRVLETGEYLRVGGTTIRKTNVRIVAATNVNMQRAISEGRFREDLYYRLNTIPIHMPPLRDRGQDIDLLFRFFALKTADTYHMEKVQLTEEARKTLLAYKWPGNIRQLKNITEQLSLLSPERIITDEIIHEFIPEEVESWSLVAPGGKTNETDREQLQVLYQALISMNQDLQQLKADVAQLKGEPVVATPATMVAPQPSTTTSMPRALENKSSESDYEEVFAEEIPAMSNNLKEHERQIIQSTLKKNGGNREKTAEELGMPKRTFYRRLKQYGLTVMMMLMVLTTALTFTSCSISYGFNGSSIDYSKTKTIQIADFPIRSSYVWGPMASIFNNQLKDQYANHTRLELVKRNGDMKVEGEITQYQQRNKSVASDGYSSQTELSITVNVRFTNNVNHKEDFERQFTASQTYENTQSLASVQEELVTQMCEDICDQIFNATVANW